jgi:hypothetical protein
MDNEKKKATNKDVLDALRDIKEKGVENARAMIFDPETGEFYLPGSDNKPSADSITINSIANDGFAN